MLQLFFEQLNVADLLNIIDTDAHLLQPAVWAFRHTHAHKTIEISGGSYNLGKKYYYRKETKETKEKSQLETWSYEMTLKMLELFGSAMQNVHINYMSMNATEVAVVNRLIREKCANHLKYLEITFDRPNQNGILIPSEFPQVERVAFTHGYIDFGAQIDLSRTFPDMKQLELLKLQSISRNVIDRHFHHLAELKVNIDIENWRRSKILEPEFENLIKKNPQIKRITVTGCSPHFLSILHENLPQLESLSLGNLDGRAFRRTSHAYHYASVQKFSMHVTSKLIAQPEKIPFTFSNRLEEVELFWICSELSDQWRAFIENNTTIQRLNIAFIPAATQNELCANFAHLTELNLPNLEVLTLQRIDLNLHEETNNFLDKIDKWHKLKAIHLVNIQNDQIDVFQQKICPIWTMTILENDQFDGMVDILITKRN